MIQEPLVADDSYEATSAPEYFPQQAQLSPLSAVASYPDEFTPSVEPTLSPSFAPTHNIGTELAYENLMTSAYHEAVACCQSCREGGGCADEGIDASYFPEDSGFGPTFEQDHSGKHGDSSNLVESAYHEAVACCQSCREGNGCAEEPSYPDYVDLRSQQNGFPEISPSQWEHDSSNYPELPMTPSPTPGSSFFPNTGVDTTFRPQGSPKPYINQVIQAAGAHGPLSPAQREQQGYAQTPLMKWPSSDERLDFMTKHDSWQILRKTQAERIDNSPVLTKIALKNKPIPGINSDIGFVKSYYPSGHNKTYQFKRMDIPKDPKKPNGPKMSIEQIQYIPQKSPSTVNAPRGLLRGYLSKFLNNYNTYVGTYLAGTNCSRSSEPTSTPIDIFKCDKLNLPANYLFKYPKSKDLAYFEKGSDRVFLNLHDKVIRREFAKRIANEVTGRPQFIQGKAQNPKQLQFVFLDNIPIPPPKPGANTFSAVRQGFDKGQPTNITFEDLKAFLKEINILGASPEVLRALLKKLGKTVDLRCESVRGKPRGMTPNPASRNQRRKKYKCFQFRHQL